MLKAAGQACSAPPAAQPLYDVGWASTNEGGGARGFPFAGLAAVAEDLYLARAADRLHIEQSPPGTVSSMENKMRLRLIL